MIHLVDTRLREEVARYRLRFTCPDCAQFEPELRGCALGYPNEPHLNPQLEVADCVIFCKAFELA